MRNASSHTIQFVHDLGNDYILNEYNIIYEPFQILLDSNKIFFQIWMIIKNIFVCKGP